jgi:uroporphyrinogen decarboxylase
MTKIQRIRAALRGEAAGRLPYGFWTHMPDIDRDPQQFAEV